MFFLSSYKYDLGNDGAQLSGSRGDTMSGGSIPGRKNLSRNNESGRIRAKILEEVGEAIEKEETAFSCVGWGDFIISEA